jgi:hypothetical protein
MNLEKEGMEGIGRRDGGNSREWEENYSPFSLDSPPFPRLQSLPYRIPSLSSQIPSLPSRTILSDCFLSHLSRLPSLPSRIPSLPSRIHSLPSPFRIPLASLSKPLISNPTTTHPTPPTSSGSSQVHDDMERCWHASIQGGCPKSAEWSNHA